MHFNGDFIRADGLKRPLPKLQKNQLRKSEFHQAFSRAIAGIFGDLRLSARGCNYTYELICVLWNHKIFLYDFEKSPKKAKCLNSWNL